MKTVKTKLLMRIPSSTSSKQKRKQTFGCSLAIKHATFPFWFFFFLSMHNTCFYIMRATDGYWRFLYPIMGVGERSVRLFPGKLYDERLVYRSGDRTRGKISVI